MNHMRSCEKERVLARAPLAVTRIAPELDAGRAARIAAVSPELVGESDNALSGNRTLKTVAIRLSTRIACTEPPPRSKEGAASGHSAGARTCRKTSATKCSIDSV